MEKLIIFKSSRNFNAVYTIASSSGGQSCTREVDAGVYKVLKVNPSSIVISKSFPITDRGPELKVYCRVPNKKIKLDSKGNYLLLGSDPITKEDLDIKFPDDLVMPNNYVKNFVAKSKPTKDSNYGFKEEDPSELENTIYVKSIRRMKATVGINSTNSITKELKPGKYAIKSISSGNIILCLTHLVKTFNGDYKSNVVLKKSDFEVTSSGNYNLKIK